MGKASVANPSGDSFVIEFHLNEAGADTKTGVTTTVETSLAVGHVGTGVTNPLTRWTAPWPCIVSEVFGEAQLTGSNDIVKYRVYKAPTGAPAAGTVVIENSTDGATSTSAIVLTATAANQFQRVRYTGDPQTAGIGTDGFNETQKLMAIGEKLKATYQMGAAGDIASHMRCFVTVSRL